MHAADRRPDSAPTNDGGRVVRRIRAPFEA